MFVPFEIEENPRYQRCGCGKVIPGVRWEERNTYDRPCCGIADKSLLVWPNPGPAKYLRLSMRYQLSHKHSDDTDIGLIMLAIAAEAAMDDLIWDLLNRKLCKSPREVAEIMEKNSSRTHRAKLYGDLAKVPLSTALQDHQTHKGFVSDWDVVAKLRNEIAHARCFDYRDYNPVTGNKTINLLVPARRFREAFLEGFAALNNRAYALPNDKSFDALEPHQKPI